MRETLALILAGGKGHRLCVLSEKRTKPAVPFGGSYRLIDFTLSNCVNSEIYDVAVLTQYRPRSLSKHVGIGRPWDLDRQRGGVELLQPYLGRADSDWYKGTADAVYQNRNYIAARRFEKVLVLSGDHVYTMDYRKMLRFHDRRKADVTVACIQVPIGDMSRFGVLELGEKRRITAFEEKPENPKSNVVSMGIYLFNKDVLLEVLKAVPRGAYDFGKNIIPAILHKWNVYGYKFTGYWRDVGTISAYYEANMDLIAPVPGLDLYDAERPITTVTYDYPPARVHAGGSISRSLISVGAEIYGTVRSSLISPGVYVGAGTAVERSIVMNDCRLGAGAVLDRAILDKEVVVGDGCIIGTGDDYTPNREYPDILNDGTVVVGRESELPAGLVLERNCCIGVGVGPADFDYTGLKVSAGTTVRAGE